MYLLLTSTFVLFENMSRQIFSDAEKMCLQELIIKYKLNKSSTLTGSQSAKKLAWNRLTEEFNATETNTKRTESQLKKCWDNLKTRQKTLLSNEKRQRMRTGGGPIEPSEPQPGTSQDSLIPEALLDQTDVELTGVIDSDTVYGSEEIVMDIEIHNPPSTEPQTEEVPSVRRASLLQDRDQVVDTPPRRSGSRFTDYGAAPSQGPRNVRTRVIEDEFNLRKDSYIQSQAREDALHQLKVKEKEWLVKAAEKTFLKMKAEHEAAEELLLCNKAKRELAELELKIKKSQN